MNTKKSITFRERVAYWNPFSRTYNFLDAVYDRVFAPEEE